MRTHIPRALVALGPVVRADASDPKALLEELNRTVVAMRQELKDEQAKADGVRNEKIDRMNAAITELQANLDEVNRKATLAKLGAGGDEPMAAERKEHAQAFARYFRKGAEANLRDLEVKAALRVDSDPDGGYTVPKEMENTIDRVLMTTSAIRSIARVQQVSSSSYKKLVSQGGATTGWVGERESRSETNSPTLSELNFPVMEIYANPGATQKILDDSAIDIAQWLADEVSMSFAEAEGAAFVSGSGINRPRGFLSYDFVANASYSWGKIGFIVSGVTSALSDASNNGVDALINVAYALKQGYRQNARWVMNRATTAAIRKLKNTVTTSGSLGYLWQPPVQVGEPATLLGYPITDDDNMPDIGANTYPVAFGDFNRGYLIVDRIGIRVLRDPYTNKPYVMFYTTKRVGGGVQNFEAIKVLKIST